MPAYYALIDVFVVPRSADDDFDLVTPLKPYEAMAAEKAVVVSGTRALREMVRDGETGEVFRTGDAEDLARVLERLAADPDRRRALGRRAREWVTRGAHVGGGRPALRAALRAVGGVLRLRPAPNRPRIVQPVNAGDDAKAPQSAGYPGEEVFGARHPIRHVFFEVPGATRLAVVYSGFERAHKPKYNYIERFEPLACHRLHILDDMGSRGCYYLGRDRDFFVARSIAALSTSGCASCGSRAATS